MHLIHGLTLDCDMPLPDLHRVASTQTPDVTIRRDDALPETPPDGTSRVAAFVARSDRCLWMTVPGVTRFMIEDGARIRYAPNGVDVRPEMTRLFLLGSCFAAALMQRGRLVLHGAAFEHGDGCALCLGASGAGKSTLAAALMQRGKRIISDDICPIDAAGRTPPGAARVKLWADSAAALGIDTTPLTRIRPELEKYALTQDNAFSAEPKEPRVIYILESHNRDDILIEPVSGVDRFKALREHTYRRRWLPKGGGALHLQQCSALASRVEMLRVYRPAMSAGIPGLAEFLMKDLARRGSDAGARA